MTRLALRRDGDQVRAALAIAFYDRRDSLSPVDSSCATPHWIANNVDEILATVERLYGDAVPSGGAGIPRPHGVPAQAAREPRSAGATRHHSRWSYRNEPRDCEASRDCGNAPLSQLLNSFRLCSWLGRGANSVGVSPAKARVWSPGVVSMRRASMLLRASGRLMNRCSLRHSRSLPVEGLDETILRRLTRRHGVHWLRGYGRHRSRHRARDLLDIGPREMRVHRQR